MHILVVNPGSTSTKIAVFENEKELFHKSLSHPVEEIAQFKAITDQYEWRKQLVLEAVKQAGCPFDFAAVVGRGGLLKPIPGGVYRVNDQMMHDVRTSEHSHASDLGCLIAYEIAKDIPGCQSFIADPVVVDELCDSARICGSPLMERLSIWHALNQRAIARRFAKEQGKRYEDFNLVIVHLGGGVSVAAHEHGKCIDVNNALDGEGPFGPERAGTLPASGLIKLCFSGEYTEAQLLKMVSGKAGLAALLGTNDMREVERSINEDHDEKATRYTDAMIYHIAKAITAQGAVLCGKVDAILITGGMARWGYLVEGLKQRCGWMAPIHCYPGEDELEALALNALDVLNGTVEAQDYK